METDIVKELLVLREDMDKVKSDIVVMLKTINSTIVMIKFITGFLAIITFMLL